MTLTSFNFLVFLCVVITAYYLVPKKFQWCILLVSSYGFYLSAGIAHVLYIIFTTLFTWTGGLVMQRIRDEYQKRLNSLGDTVAKEQKRDMKAAVSARIRRVHVITVLVNLCVLAYIKYLNFFIGNINNTFSLFQWDASVPMVNVIVPLGLSYYTFNSVGYLVDVGRGKHAAERHLGKFALFVSFFPSIVQGPLFRFNDVGIQLQQPHEFEYDHLKFGAQLILWGFFKKLLIADRIAVVAMTVFSPDFYAVNGSQVFLGVLAYSFQIYCDFSGGTDITRGVAQMMGINLPVNFERPFFATSMADFWRRWHMSLGAWMREFVFYPVMLSKPITSLSKKFRQRYGNHAGKMVPSVAAPMVVFFLIGIWHGLTWQYIVNGLYNAILISSTVALTPLYKKLTEKLHINTESFGFRLFQMLRTFCLLCISRIIVKAPGLREALRMIKLLFTSADFSLFIGSGGQLLDYGLQKRECLLLAAAIFLLFIVGVLQERGVKIRETLSKQCLVIRWGVLLGMLFVILVFGVYGPAYNASSFIYEAF